MDGKRILVVGYKGNMGSRYTAILDYLGVDWVGVDFKESTGAGYAEKVDGVIDAGPTALRMTRLRTLVSRFPGAPILAEKPFTTHGLAWKVIGDHGLLNTPVQMVNQYVFMGGYRLPPGHSDHTYYNYFKHGGDGLAFDCINILGLAKGSVDLLGTSPIWKCEINGRTLSIQDMDRAYIAMVERWLKKPVSNWDYIVHAHRKAYEYEKGRHRDPGEIDQRATA